MLRRDLSDWQQADVDRYIDRHYPDYWLRTDAERRVEHAKLLRRAENEGLHVATDTRTDAFTAITELTVVAPNHPRLLSLFAGACAAAGANIAGAHIMTTRDGYALDTFLLNRAFKDDEDELRRGKRIGDLIGRLLRGDAWLDTLLAERGPPPRRVMAFTVEPDVIINNALSDQFTVIEVAGRDRPGLLVRADEHALQPDARHHLGAHHDVRREGRRRVLRDGSDGQEDRQRVAAGDDPQAARSGPRRKRRKVRAQSGAGLARHDHLDAAVELIEVFLAEIAAHDAGIRLRLALGHQLELAAEAALAQEARDRLQTLARIGSC